MIVGEMVIAQQRLMKLVEIANGIAKLKYIDGDGIEHDRTVSVSALAPFWLAFMPQTWWPEGGNLSEVEAEREERARQAERNARAKIKRKARRSNKIKREVTA